MLIKEEFFAIREARVREMLRDDTAEGWLTQTLEMKSGDAGLDYSLLSSYVRSSGFCQRFQTCVAHDMYLPCMLSRVALYVENVTLKCIDRGSFEGMLCRLASSIVN